MEGSMAPVPSHFSITQTCSIFKQQSNPFLSEKNLESTKNYFKRIREMSRIGKYIERERESRLAAGGWE